MVKISNYRSDRILRADDKIIGTDADGRITKNFTLDDLSLFFQTNSENGVNLTGIHGRILNIENGNFVIDLYASKQYVSDALSSYSDSVATASLIRSATEDKVELQDFRELQTSVGGNRASISETLTAVSTEREARVEAIEILNTNVGNNSTSITTNRNAITTETDARVQAIQELTTSVGNNRTSITNNTNAIATEGYARVQAISTLSTLVGNNRTSITNNTNAITTETDARVEAIQELTTSVNNSSASVTTTSTAVANINGRLEAKYGLTLNAGNAIAGISLLADGEADTSEIKFNAESFKFQNGEGTLTPFQIDATNSKINFTGDVVFGIDEYSDNKVQDYIDGVGEIFTSTTTISGGQITTGIIKNSTYPHSAGHSGFATSGMAIDLDNASLHSKNFHIDSNGSATFKGRIEISSGNSTDAASRTVANQTITLDPTAGAITLAHEGITGGDGVEEDGEVVVDSIGITTSTAGIIKPTGDFYPYTPWTFGSNTGYSNVSAWFHGKASRTELYTVEEGVSYIAGAYFSAENKASNYTTSYTPSAAYGAVIENARIEGEVRWMEDGVGGPSADNKRQLQSKYCGFYDETTGDVLSHVQLFANAHKWQVYDVMHYDRTGRTRVYAPVVSNSIHADLGDGVHNDNRQNILSFIGRGNDQYAYVDVVNRETIRFMWVGTHWRIVHFDRLH